MRNTPVLIVLFLLNIQFLFSQTIDSISIYYLSFHANTRYGYWEKDLVNNKEPKFVLKGRKAEKCYQKVRERINFSKNEATPLEKQSRNLRMVCILYYRDKTMDTIGFSYLKDMSINHILYRRDDQLLKAFLKFIPSRSFRKSVKDFLD